MEIKANLFFVEEYFNLERRMGLRNPDLNRAKVALAHYYHVPIEEVLLLERRDETFISKLKLGRKRTPFGFVCSASNKRLTFNYYDTTYRKDRQRSK